MSADSIILCPNCVRLGRVDAGHTLRQYMYTGPNIISDREDNFILELEMGAVCEECGFECRYNCVDGLEVIST